MKNHLRLLYVFITVLFFLQPSTCHADANYWGATGLIRTPNARVVADGDIRFTVSQSNPYREYAVTFGYFPFLELTGGFTELLGLRMAGSGWEQYGNYKDKNVAFKILLCNENQWLPALSYGIRDFHGTQLFFNEYIATSKKIGPVDITLGCGGNLSGLFNSAGVTEREMSGMFGGLEYSLNPKLSLLLEYDPTNQIVQHDMYLASGKEYGYESHFNYGARWKPLKWLNVDYTYQRGQEHSVSVSLTFPFGQPLRPHKPEYPFYGPVNREPFFSDILENGISGRLTVIKDYLVEEGLGNVRVTASADLRQINIEYENGKYISQVKGLGRVLRIASAQSPKEVDQITVIIKSMDIPMVEVSVNPRDFINFINGLISGQEMLERTKITNWISREEDTVGLAEKKYLYPSFSFSFKPVTIDSHLNAAKRFYSARIGPQIFLDEDFSRGLSASASIKFPLYNNITDLPSLRLMDHNPVRSDVVEYFWGNDPVLDYLLVNKFFRSGNTGFYRLTAGYLEFQYAGITEEYMRLFKDGRFGLGHEITWAQKRKAGSYFDLAGLTTTTYFLNTFYFSPKFNTTFQVKAGQFLGGDKGVRLTSIKHLRGGGSIYLWYTKTNTDGFIGENSGYADKGVGFVLPVNVFRDHDTQGYYYDAFAPWTRDVGQSVGQAYSLYDFIFQYTPAQIIRNWDDITQ